MTFKHEPPLPSSLPRAEREGFLQTIQIPGGSDVLATACWHAPSGREGVVQLIELSVDPAQRRQGLGTALLREVMQQATALHKAKRIRLRRMWISVEQKTQVNGRAFLTKHGFHHNATITELLDDQDALLYVRTFD
jgi:ribosomal protein S18 acetylase RimI-like enzyme